MARHILPIARLMIEHRLIERMIAVMRRMSAKMEKSDSADVRFVEATIDFIRVYADRLHHGKEEGILFRDLAARQLEPEHRKVMEELVFEHVFGRGEVARLVEAKSRYASGDKSALAGIVRSMQSLSDFYPKHIRKEDRHFFLPAMRYFSLEEQDRMLAEEDDFDRRFIHNLYGGAVENWEREVGSTSSDLTHPGAALITGP